MELRGGITRYTTVKGLEGSCDLACSRTAIIGIGQIGSDSSFERLHLHPHEYGFAEKDVPLESIAGLIEQMQLILEGKSCELMSAAIWNGGFYLWNCGICPDISAGFAEAEAMLTKGQVAQKLEEIRDAIAEVQLTPQV